LAFACTLGVAWWLRQPTYPGSNGPSPETWAAPPPAMTKSTALAGAPGVTEPARTDAVKPAASLAGQVDQWIRNANSADAMRAYGAVSNCLLARRREHLPPDRFVDVPLPGKTAQELCGDLRSDQVQGRTRWLERAAQAGEPGAAEWFIQEGPAGDGLLLDLDTPTNDEALTADWLRRRDAYIDLALRHCDNGVAVYLASFASGVPADDAVARDYWSGTRLVCPGTPERTLPPLADDPVGQRLLEGLRHRRDGTLMSRPAQASG
jgi:hypothetical protein